MKTKTTSRGVTRRTFFRTAGAALTALGVKGATAVIANVASPPTRASRVKRPSCCSPKAAVEDQEPGRDDDGSAGEEVSVSF